jgi:hypothetical protein
MIIMRGYEKEVRDMSWEVRGMGERGVFVDEICFGNVRLYVETSRKHKILKMFAVSEEQGCAVYRFCLFIQ